jgi:TolA-binding protein
MKTRWLAALILGLSSIGSAARADDKNSSGVLDNLKFIQGDEVGNEKKAMKAELLVSATEQKAIAQVQKLIKKYKGTPLEPDLQFRLAEMYMRKSKTDRFFEIRREDSNIKLSPRVAKKESSRSSLSQAVEVYQYIQKRFPGYNQMDLVVFNHAFARQALGQDKEAENLYWDLVRKFPDSPLVPDAHLAIGEIAFLKAKFTVALEHFDAIRKYPDSRVYPYGLYKAAWTRYNMHESAAALKNLEEVVAFGVKVAENHLDAKLDLRKEALNDMTVFFEDVHASKEAFSYFRHQAGEVELPSILMRLSELYDRHARYTDEREVLGQFVSKIPESKLMPEARAKMIAAADAMKQKDVAVSDMEAFGKACEPRSDFVKANPDQAQSCRDVLQKSALLLAQKWLRIWNKNIHDETFAESAEKAFQIYLRYNKSNEEYQKAHFLYAELLFKRGKYRQASSEYADVGSSKTVTTSDQIAHDADYAACLSLEKAVGDKEKWSDDDEKSFHRLAMKYVGDHPKGQYRLEIEFKMAFLAYEKNRYDEAAPMFLRLGQQFPKDEKGLKAQDLYLDILNLKKDYAGIRAYSRELLKKPVSEERNAKIAKLAEQAYFLQIQTLEEKGDLKSALHEYHNFIKDYSRSDLAEKAHWNMVQLFYKTGDTFGGAQAALDFAKKYPNSPQSTPALEGAAQTFEQMAQLEPAANVLVQLADREQKEKLKFKELAADFFALSGHTASARKLYQELLPLLKDDEKIRLLSKLENFEKNYGTEQSHASLVKELAQKGVAPFANQGKLDHLKKLWQAGDMSATFQESKRLLGMASLSAAEKAQVRLIQAQVLEDEFIKQSVKSKSERLAIVLAIKTEKLEKAQSAFQSVIRFGEATSALASLEHLYSCFDHYVKALKSIPTPDGMSAAEASAFQNEMQNLIMPLEEKGVETLSQALAFAKKNRMFDDIPRLEATLAKANGQTVTHEVAVVEPAMALPVQQWGAP